MLNEYDVVIIGAGFTGLSLAHLLDRLPLKVLLIEKHTLAQMFDPNTDNRGIALAQASCDLLRQLNLIENLFTDYNKINKVHVTARGAFGATDIKSTHALGYVVDSAHLGRALVKKFTNVQVKEQTSISDLEYLIDTKIWEFKINQEKYTTKLLIGADGMNSIVRHTLHIENEEVLTDHGAMICNLTIAKDHHGVAHQRFIDNRVLALLPFGEKRLKCVVTFNNYQKASLELSDQEYVAMIQDLIGARFKILHASARLYYPVQQVRAKRIIAPNTVLIGNAANTLSPVAAQGLNLGLRDVAALSELLSVNGLSDLPTLLQTYAQQRTVDHLQTSNFTKNIHKYMTSSFKFGRGALLMALELQPWLRRMVIRGSGSLI